ncbi:MAG: helix-turn-helix transcriptional regulator [Elusimicrobia bacterium]|nr:helix-turn-helix transcriptional regulator [Elusimicrobiota bacterium]
MDNILNTINTEDPAEAGLALASRLRSLRLSKGWTRNTLAERSGISPASLKRFENTGKASLDLLLKAAHSLSRLDDFKGLLQPTAARSLAELEERAAKPPRRRGRV